MKNKENGKVYPEVEWVATYRRARFRGPSLKVVTFYSLQLKFWVLDRFSGKTLNIYYPGSHFVLIRLWWKEKDRGLCWDFEFGKKVQVLRLNSIFSKFCICSNHSRPTVWSDFTLLLLELVVQRPCYFFEATYLRLLFAVNNFVQVRRYSDYPPSYDALSSDQAPPSYNSVVIIEEEAPPGDRSSRSSGIRTYVYDPARRISIEV